MGVLNGMTVVLWGVHNVMGASALFTTVNLTSLAVEYFLFIDPAR
jgi:hypothetical protein